MRFDDTLETVLAGDLSTPFGKQSAWRQLVDLIGRRRVPPDTRALATLHEIRESIPLAVRAASARGLELADPPVALVRLLAVDAISVAAPVLRSARLPSNDWIAMLPDLGAAARSVLRSRRDLGPAVKRALESFGPADFILARDETVAKAPAGSIIFWDEVAEAGEAYPTHEAEPEDAEADTALIHEPVEETLDWGEVLAARPPEPAPSLPVADPAPAASTREEREETVDAAGADVASLLSDASADDASGAIPLPVPDGGERSAPRAEPIAVRIAPESEEPAVIESLPAPAAMAALASEEPDLSFVALAGVAATFGAPKPEDAPPKPFVADGDVASGGARESAAVARAADGEAALDPEEQVAETVDDGATEAEGPFEIADVVARIDAFWRQQQEAPREADTRADAPDGFRFETDSQGIVRWVEGVSRAPLVGLSLDVQGAPGAARVDAAATGAFRRRAGFSNARLSLEGDTDASGDWLISAIPVFDPTIGRFTGYRGTARRPRVDERAEPSRAASPNPADSLRQLVHELRTPTNAIAGFAEMIETQILGPVSEPYRNRAGVIRSQAKELLGAIDDLDLAARIESDALALVPGQVALRPVLAGIADDLAQLAEIRGSWIALPVDDFVVKGDRRAVERLLARLIATLVSASGRGERIGVRAAMEHDAMVAIALERPSALADFPGEAMLGIDDEGSDATLLGTGFALRLARNLARELGGSMVIDADSLTLRLPAAVTGEMEQARLN